MSTEDQGIVYGNVGILDIRNADPDALRGISRIGNVGLVLHSEENAALVNLLSIGNLGNTVEMPPRGKLEMGSVRLDANALSNRTEPINMIVMGSVTVAADVTAADIEEGVERLIVMGTVVCPDNLVAALRSRIARQMGVVDSYPAGAELISVSGSLQLDHVTLAAMEDGTALLVHGRLIVAEALLQRELLECKLSWLKVHGPVLCNEENAPLLRSFMPDHAGRFTVLPAGFRIIERSLTIDSAFLRFSGANKVYCTGRVIVDSEVTAAEVERYLKGLRCTEMIVAPAALRDALAPKCDLAADRVLFYDGALWLEDDSSELAVERFSYLDGAATLLVDGQLAIHRGVEPAVLAERLAKVHNFGLIRCTPAQMSALQARMGIGDGLIDSSNGNEEDDEKSLGIGNIGYLTL